MVWMVWMVKKVFSGRTPNRSSKGAILKDLPIGSRGAIGISIHPFLPIRTFRANILFISKQVKIWRTRNEK